MLERAPSDSPSFLIINFNVLYPPMRITARMERQYCGQGDRRIPHPHNYSGDFPEDQHIRIRQNYSAMIETIDRWLGIFQDRLRDRGDLDITVGGLLE